MARHLSEDAAAKEELDALQDDEAAFRVDYKMKILPAAYRESQKMWFGKKGTTMIGAMIIINDKDGGDMKNVNFVMMATDDSKQDYHAVACAKTFLYEKCLPSHIKKARFCSDGAGCFKSKHHRGFQPFWKHWTGIDEVSLRITPAGDGKTTLDGMFARVNQILDQAIANGFSYWHADSIGEALESTDGLPATTFHVYTPNRSIQVEVDISGVDDFGSILTTNLSSSRSANCNNSIAFCHTGYGNGITIVPERMISFNIIYDENRKETIHPYSPDVSIFVL